MIYQTVIYTVRIPKNLDTKNTCNYCIGNCPKNRTVWFYNAIMQPKDAERIASSVDSDQTAPRRSLSLVCIVCPDLLSHYIELYVIQTTRMPRQSPVCPALIGKKAVW